MVRSYLKERRSWIFLFLALQALLIFIAYIDPAISLSSVFYYAFLSLLIFTIFVFFRFPKETKFYHEISEKDEEFDLSRIPHPDTPFEKIVTESLSRQSEGLRKTAELSDFYLEEEKDEMLSWIHEVKTPLTALHLMIDRLSDQSLKKEMTYEWLRIHLLLDQQLHQKRIPFMENDLYIETTDLEGIIFAEIKSLQTWCIQKGIGFDVDLQIREVLTDAKWLSFIIRQLLTNAVKYSADSDISIRSFDRNGQVALEVNDNGRGIDSRDLPRIFDKGFTSTAHHQDKAATGMGLYLASKAAKPLLIQITAESEPGIGSTFRLTFPKSNEFVRITGM
ncbi:sensor histidine kinase [Bacillus sp. ISL-37]|uniref:sensor histidine kinase n=1 Tax=Bacillus sp. ISL-37 TaxID=2819123 RepID=UPI001BE90449|nr:sensor histidine kinase [Bacillus sp. ISL-37]MBT2682853.1 sensor histidine kinase [Bacillus sp. ISL-37]